MTDKLLIEREVLERLACEVIPKTHQEMLDASEDFGAAIKELRAILAAPRQLEGEVQPEWVTIEIQRNTINYLNRDIAELREECERLRGEVENKYREVSKNEIALEAERDTLRQQLVERDATIERLEAGIPRIQEQSHQMRQQRDKLAGLLREVRVIVAREVERWTRSAAILPVNANVESGLLTRIDAVLAEVKPCQESPQPAAT